MTKWQSILEPELYSRLIFQKIDALKHTWKSTIICCLERDGNLSFKFFAKISGVGYFENKINLVPETKMPLVN